MRVKSVAAQWWCIRCGLSQPGHEKSLVVTAFVQIGQTPWERGHWGMALARA